VDRERDQAVRDVQGARGKDSLPADLLALDARVTDCNSAFFDVANNFHGCIAGCHEILRRQGLMQGLWCLDPDEGLSPGQMQEIDRVCREHADLSDDAFREGEPAEMAGMTAESPSSACATSARSIVPRARNSSPSPTSPWTSAKGELVSLVGPSGCGKTTVLKIWPGCTRPTAAPSRSAMRKRRSTLRAISAWCSSRHCC
jgi:hypothetical protein